MSAERDAVERAAVVLSEHLRAETESRARLSCQLGRDSSAMTLLLLDSVGRPRRAPSEMLRHPEVRRLMSGERADDRVIELTVDRSGDWEALIVAGDPRTVLIVRSRSRLR